jgi:hypothetical protein
VLSIIAVFAAPFGDAESQTIKKCQDATGKWHYGDIAADECTRSRITEIDKRGLKVDVHDAPPTREELEAARATEATRQEEEARAQEQRRRDNHLLAIYDSEQSIILARDERLASIDRMLKSDENYKAKLQDNLSGLEKLAGRNSSDEKLQKDIEALRTQIREYEEAIDARLRQRELVIGRYTSDLNHYRDIVKRRKESR